MWSTDANWICYSLNIYPSKRALKTCSHLFSFRNGTFWHALPSLASLVLLTWPIVILKLYLRAVRMVSEDLEYSVWVEWTTFMNVLFMYLFIFWSLTVWIRIHFHCMEESSLGILPNIQVCNGICKLYKFKGDRFLSWTSKH